MIVLRFVVFGDNLKNGLAEHADNIKRSKVEFLKNLSTVDNIGRLFGESVC